MDKYKNKKDNMPLHVPESLFEHYLYENASKAQELFQKKGFSNNEVYLKFKEAFSDVPDFQGKFAEWILDISDDEWDDDDIDYALSKIEDLREIISSFQNQGYKVDFNIDKINSPDQLVNILRRSSKMQRKDFKINKTPLLPKIKNPLQLKIPGMSGDRLWIYGVLIKTSDGKYVKFGDHRGPNRDDAIEYAMSQTIGKARGIVSDSTEVDVTDLQEQGKDVDAVSLIFVEDVTEYAASKGYPVERQKFDDHIRHLMPGKRGIIKNSRGQVSRELHVHNINETDPKIINDWKTAIEKMLEEGGVPTKKEKVEARPFHDEMNKKLDLKENGNYKSDKHLLGAATGAGKELVTLSTLIHINDSRNDLFNENTVHVATATIPSTISELFKELSTKSGISTKKGNVDFSRIKPYCLKRFADNYKKDLPETVRDWFDDNVDQIESVKEIGQRTLKQIPVLFGSFPDLGLKTANEDPDGAYESLGDRIGILSIGEGHQFLSNTENKLWKSIKEDLHFKFLFIITGTPYDFIFNESGQDYFRPDERTIFNRNDLYELKRKEPDGPFGNYPDINYFNLDIGDVYEEMKKDPQWKDDKHGFTWHKFFEIKDGDFKYSTLIAKFFSKLFSVDYDTGLPDPLSIEKVPDKYLSKDAKKHIIVALPAGSGTEGGVQKYIPKLINELRDKGALGNYIALDPYTDNLKKIKEDIEKNEKHTITFTCNKYLTGTDIPAWGALIFLRPIGSSIKFFEQATGRIARALKGGKKEEVGVFLGNLENAVNLHISVDEMMDSEKGNSTPYDEIVKKTLQNYNWIKPGKNGEWSLIDDWRELADFQGELAGDIDYGTLLCLKKTHAPENFGLEFKKIIQDAEDQIEISSSNNKGAKNKEDELKIRQTKIDFEEFNKDPEKWYRNMIISHIPKIITICVINNIRTIEEFSKKIKKDKDLLDLIGRGSEYVTSYIDDDNQINKKYINRKISNILGSSSFKPGLENFKERYNVINKKLDISEIDESIVFDPLEITDKICQKIQTKLKSSNRILILEKNGAFLYSILKIIGYSGLSDLHIIVLDPLSKKIIEYLLGNDKKLTHINYIKSTINEFNKILKMPKFDVILGNPPYKKDLHLKMLKVAYEALAEDGEIVWLHPARWMQDPIASLKQGSDFSKYKDLPFIDFNIISTGEASNIFNNRMTSDLVISHLKEGQKSILNEEKLYEINKIPPFIKKVFQSSLPSLKDKSEKNKRDGIRVRLRPVIGMTRGDVSRHIYNIIAKPNEIIVNGLVGDKDWTENVQRNQFTKPKGSPIPLSIKFDTANEARNFIDSTNTDFYTYLNYITKKDVNVHLGFLPFMEDYRSPWDDDRFQKSFNIEDKDMESIKETIENKIHGTKRKKEK